MAAIAYTKRINKNTWSIMYNGTSEFAMTAFNAINLSNNSTAIALAIGDGTIVEGANTCFDANTSVVTTNTSSILLSDTVAISETLYWDTASGKILLPVGKQLLVGIAGPAGANLEISMFGLEL